MNAVAKHPGVELTVIETTCHDDHHWKRAEKDPPFRLITLSDEIYSNRVDYATRIAYHTALDTCSPDVLVECGYAEACSRQVAFHYHATHPSSRLLVWSESTIFDHPRHWSRELVKRVLVGMFDGAIAAGPSHAEYLRFLGMRHDNIAVVGNCVDDNFFRLGADAARKAGRGYLPERYFLFVGRFISIKNLSFLLRAYGWYRLHTKGLPVDLVLVGSGPLESSLRSQVELERITGVHFAGSKQAGDLPAYYAHALALVLPSTSEPWGLVVNEALACGIPALVSDHCGCADTLISEGRTGFRFDPVNQPQLSTLLERIGTGLATPVIMSKEILDAASTCDPDVYGSLIVDHISKLIETDPSRTSAAIRCTAKVINLLSGVMSRYRWATKGSV